MMDKEPEELTAGLANKPVNIRGEIEFRKVWFAYKDEDFVLKDISLKVKAEEKVAFVGASGGGKTSIMSLLFRFYEATRGEILFDGRNINTFSPQELREHMGMVLQEVFIFDGTVSRNIRLGDQSISDAQLFQAAKDVHADSFIEKLPDKYEH